LRSAVRILVVDDFALLRQFVVGLLGKRPELQVVGEASDGLETLQRAVELRPDLILLDIGLPNLSGIEVARRVRTLVPHAKILFFSAESFPDTVQEALSAGAFAYVHKQRASDLLPAIDAVLAGKRFVSSGLEFTENLNVQVPCRHEILFCSDDEDLLDGLAEFIAAALRTGNPALVVATEPHRNSLLQRLRENGVAVDAAMQQRTCAWLDASEATDLARFLNLAGDLIEAASTVLGASHPRLALCGERAGRLWAEGQTDAALQLEQLCNDLGRSLEADILCVYPVGDISGKEAELAFERICAEHSAVHSR
jgi:CheY-like chemotaxis protein